MCFAQGVRLVRVGQIAHLGLTHGSGQAGHDLVLGHFEGHPGGDDCLAVVDWAGSVGLAHRDGCGSHDHRDAAGHS